MEGTPAKRGCPGVRVILLCSGSEQEGLGVVVSAVFWRCRGRLLRPSSVMGLG